MASERESALNNVVTGEATIVTRLDAAGESNLDDALSQAETTRQLEARNRHDLERLHAELGWFGKVFGSESHAAIVIAFVVILLGFGSAIVLWVVAAHSATPDRWTSEAHIALGAATSALSYVFGRGSRDPVK